MSYQCQLMYMYIGLINYYSYITGLSSREEKEHSGLKGTNSVDQTMISANDTYNQWKKYCVQEIYNMKCTWYISISNVHVAKQN